MTSRRTSFADVCSQCGHPFNWHHNQSDKHCTFHECRCPQFALEPTPTGHEVAPKSREQLGLNREVVDAIGGDDFDFVLLKCGHWFRAHHGFTGTTAGCVGCESAERLGAMADRLRTELAAVTAERNRYAPTTDERLAELRIRATGFGTWAFRHAAQKELDIEADRARSEEARLRGELAAVQAERDTLRAVIETRGVCRVCRGTNKSSCRCDGQFCRSPESCNASPCWACKGKLLDGWAYDALNPEPAS